MFFITHSDHFMNTYTYLCFLTTIAILISFITRKLNDNIQYTIAITATSMAGSLFLVLLGYFNWFNLDDIATRVIERIDFKDFLLNGILGFLLFAGALGIKTSCIEQSKMGNYHFRPVLNTCFYFLYWFSTLWHCLTFRMAY